MKKLISLLAMLALVAATPKASQAQLPTLLSLKGSVGGGYSFGTGDFKAGDNALSGFTYGGKLKLGLPLAPVKIVGILNNTAFSATSSGIDYTTNIFGAGVGVEFELPLPVVSPYLALDVALQSIKTTKPFEFDATNRTGLGLGIGAEIAIPLSPISIDVEAKYRFANLIGKQDATIGGVTVSEASINYVQIMAHVMFTIL